MRACSARVISDHVALHAWVETCWLSRTLSIVWFARLWVSHPLFSISQHCTFWVFDGARD